MIVDDENGLPSRIEVHDAEGVVRVVLGALDEPGTYGISLRGPDGAERLSLSVGDDGSSLVFVRNGNIALQLGVDEPVEPGDLGGAFITVADRTGTPVLYLAAGDDGSVQVRGPLTGGGESPSP